MKTEPFAINDEETYEAFKRTHHAAEAIKNEGDIDRIVNFLYDNKRYRDLLMFVMGINFGLRCGDLVSLHVGDVIDEEGNIVSTFEMEEEKTDKVRRMAVNSSVVEVLRLYLHEKYGDAPIKRTDVLFTSVSNHGYKEGKPLSVRSVDRILKSIVNDELGIPVHASTHMLRKTFAYHFLMKAPDRTRALEMLSMQLNHSTLAYTLRYIGITQAEILQTCFDMNLGGNLWGDSDSGNVVAFPINTQKKEIG